MGAQPPPNQQLIFAFYLLTSIVVPFSPISRQLPRRPAKTKPQLAGRSAATPSLKNRQARLQPLSLSFITSLAADLTGAATKVSVDH